MTYFVIYSKIRNMEASVITAARRGPSVRPSTPAGLENVANVVAVGSGKGGVGKSTVAANLAAALVRRGARVGVLDADVYGPSQPRLLGAASAKADRSREILAPLESHGVRFMSVQALVPADSPVVWRAPMVVKLLHDFVGAVAWGSLDYLLVDLPPGTGDVQLTLAQSAGLTGAIVVTTPQGVALDVARKGLKMFQQVKVPILGIIENMSGYVCPQCGHREDIFLFDGGKGLAAESGVPFLGAIPLDPAVVRSGEEGTPLSDGNDSSPAARAFGQLADAFEREVARANGGASGGPQSWRLTDAGALDIVWEDGARSSYEPYSLRLQCPCAFCVDERTGTKVLDAARVPLDVKIVELRPVGLYGLSPRFSDGHDTGIFTFQKLRSSAAGPAGQALPL